MRMGIDFGTTCTKAAATDGYGTPCVLGLGVDKSTPSAFYHDDRRGDLVGKEAKAAGQGELSANMVDKFKMHLVDDDGHDVIHDFGHDGSASFTSTQIVKAILARVREDALTAARQMSGFDESDEGVVLTVPAGFNGSEKNCILRAASGMHVLGLVKEPAAAALACCHDDMPGDGENVLVYDLGGGTCDVAVVKAHAARDANDGKHGGAWFEEIGCGMERVGGRDWDERLAEHLAGKRRTSLRDMNPMDRDQLRTEAAACKERLSAERQTTAVFTIHDGARADIAAIDVTRDTFDGITVELLERTIGLTRRVIDSLPPREALALHRVVCVGGGSNMLQVRERLQWEFPDLRVGVAKDPEYAVARGAALYAAHCAPDGLGADTDGDGPYLAGRATASYGLPVRDRARNVDQLRNLIIVGDELPRHASFGLITPTTGSFGKAPVTIWTNDADTTHTEIWRKGGTPAIDAMVDLGCDAAPNTPFRLDVSLDTGGLLRIRLRTAEGRQVGDAVETTVRTTA